MLTRRDGLRASATDAERMSTVFLHVGQCGNQLGQAFWQEVEEWNALSIKKPPRQSPSSSAAARKITADHRSIPYSLLDGTLPCLLVDTEPKVIGRCAKLLSSKIPKDFLITDKAGRGNNWAYGYRGRPSGRPVSSLGDRESLKITERVREQMRKLVEKCDRFGGTVVFHSVAGGTGSGLSSALLEHLRDNYPLAYIIAASVAPFSYGETPLQHYNSLLCLSRLQTYTDAVMLFQNDSTLEQVLNYSISAGRDGAAADSKRSVSLEDMNKHISTALCSCFLPLWDVKQRCPHLSGQEPWELIRSVCPDPATKFLTPVHTHFTKATVSWDQAVSRLLHINTLQKKPTTLSSTNPSKASASSVLLVSRSNPSSIDTLVRNVSSYERKLKHALNTVQWNPFPVDYWFSYEPHLAERKILTILANSSSICSYLDLVHKRADLMFKEKAYVHWYKKYGCDEDTFTEGFERVQCIINSYEFIQKGH